VLVQCYGEVAATGQWLFRKQPELAARFPSLWTAGRRPPPRRSKKAGAAETPAQGDGAANGPAVSP
jgi:hypothetical protein